MTEELDTLNEMIKEQETEITKTATQIEVAEAHLISLQLQTKELVEECEERVQEIKAIARAEKEIIDTDHQRAESQLKVYRDALAKAERYLKVLQSSFLSATPTIVVPTTSLITPQSVTLAAPISALSMLIPPKRRHKLNLTREAAQKKMDQIIKHSQIRGPGYRIAMTVKALASDPSDPTRWWTIKEAANWVGKRNKKASNPQKDIENSQNKIFNTLSRLNIVVISHEGGRDWPEVARLTDFGWYMAEHVVSLESLRRTRGGRVIFEVKKLSFWDTIDNFRTYNWANLTGLTFYGISYSAMSWLLSGVKDKKSDRNVFAARHNHIVMEEGIRGLRVREAIQFGLDNAIELVNRSDEELCYILAKEHPYRHLIDWHTFSDPIIAHLRISKPF